MDAAKKRRCWIVLGVLLVLGAVFGYIGWDRFFREGPEPQWANAEERFKYGSIGGEETAGIPYWLFYVLPRVFPDKLPGPGGYASLGVAWEQGQELPVGFTKKRIGFDRVANNCAVCHTASYRAIADENPHFVPTGPNQRLRLQAFFRFLIDCAKDPRFEADVLLPEIRLVTEFDLIDRLAWRYLIIPITRKRLLEREAQFQWIYHKEFPEWGPGRDDSFNLTKYFLIKSKMDDSFGPSDIPSIWNLGKYQSDKGHRMNFGGESLDARSVIIDSALGVLGAPPKDNGVFLAQIDWLQEYLFKARAPAYPYAIDEARAAAGKTLFDAQCARCHASARTGTIVPIAEIGTDASHLATWSGQAAKDANRLTQEMGIERPGLAEENPTGYIAPFLDGIWLRAPYLQNGSVPSLRDLLEPAAKRPAEFWRGDDVFDPVRVGFVSSGTRAEKRGERYDTRLRGNGNGGHEQGTSLSDAEKEALVEFLKTL